MVTSALPECWQPHTRRVEERVSELVKIALQNDAEVIDNHSPKLQLEKEQLPHRDRGNS